MSDKKHRWRGELPQLLLLVFCVLAARSSLADHYYVPSGSMEHTLQAGDRVVVDKRAYGLRVPFTTVELLAGAPVARGEVVIFDEPDSGERLIKRIVGVGGDHVSLRRGQLYVDGAALSVAGSSVEAFGERLVELNLRHGGGPDIPALTIPPGMLLAIGDHRGNSRDGRYFGLIPDDAVYGKALGVYRRRGEGFVWLPL